MIHVFIGTKAQYVKTAPLLRLMDTEGVPYRLIDSGQHGAFSVDLRDELGVREPDYVLGKGSDISSIPQAVAWSAKLGRRLFSGRRLRESVFGGEAGVCVVHGDTPSTLLSALMARRAGLSVAHLEAGLRSYNFAQPFPEELIRVWTMHLSTYLFVPDDVAMANIASMGLIERAIPTGANTSVEALSYAAGGIDVVPSGPVVVTMHRVENLKLADRVRGFTDLVLRIANDRDVLMVLHGPTEIALDKAGKLGELEAAGVRTTTLLAHGEFTQALASAPFVVTDGGSVQEECALLGVPTLLWRGRTERPDGLGGNVVLSHYDQPVVDDFLENFESYRRHPKGLDAEPSRIVLDTLLAGG